MRLRYSSQGTDSNLVSMQRSSSLPASSHATQSSIIPSSSSPSSTPTNLTTSPFSYPPQAQTSQDMSENLQDNLALPAGKYTYAMTYRYYDT